MILQRLKTETHDLHERLEAQVDLLGTKWDRKRYRQLLQRFYGFYQPLEPALLARPEWRETNFAPFHRRKTQWLRSDLHILGLSGHEIDTLPRCTRLPRVATFARTLGCLYVLEGATLGGQILSRHFAASLGVDRERGCAFFTSYGPDLGPMWKDFGAMLRAQAERLNDDDSMVDAARETFSTLSAWLLPEVKSPDSRPVAAYTH